jgi:C4-dicarboxylate transporter, DctQ subunit
MRNSSKRPFFLNRWIDTSADVGGVIGAVCLLTVSFIVTYEVCMRYLFKSPTTWVAELSVYLCMGIGLLGAAYALKSDSHFTIDIFVDRLKPENRRRIKILTNLMGFAYSCVFVYKGIEMVKFSYDMEDISTGMLETPLWIPQLLIPIGGLLLASQFINKLTGEFGKQASG